MEEVLDMSSENMALLKEEARLVEADVLMRYIRIFSELSNQVKYSSQKRILIEIAIIKLCKPAMETNMDSITDRLAKLEKKMEQGIPTAAPVNTATQPYRGSSTGQPSANAKSNPGRCGTDCKELEFHSAEDERRGAHLS